jgi:hypothetical protein
MGKEAKPLEHHRDFGPTDIPQPRLAHMGNVFTIDKNVAAGGINQTVKAAHQG